MEDDKSHGETVQYLGKLQVDGQLSGFGQLTARRMLRSETFPSTLAHEAGKGLLCATTGMYMFLATAFP